jgi:hypothetical protein
MPYGERKGDEMVYHEGSLRYAGVCKQRSSVTASRPRGRETKQV